MWNNTREELIASLSREDCEAMLKQLDRFGSDRIAVPFITHLDEPTKIVDPVTGEKELTSVGIGQHVFTREQIRDMM